MKYSFTTEELLPLLRSYSKEASPASPFRSLMTLNREFPAVPLSEEQQLLCAFALTPEQVLVLGRHSSADGELYLLNIGAIWYLYTWLENQDLHVFEAYFDRPRLLKFLQKNFCGFYEPNFGAFTQLDVKLTHREFTVLNLIRGLYAARAKTDGIGNNDSFLADDLKTADLALYLRNYLDELGLEAVSDRIDALMEEKNHDQTDEALKGLEEKGILTPDINDLTLDSAYRLTRTALERLDDGMLIDTVWYADRTDPAETREVLLCLRRDGILAVIPTENGVTLRSMSEIPWENLI